MEQQLSVYFVVHFFAHQHIAHTTNFSDLVDLVVSCGGENLKNFLRKECYIHIKRCCNWLCWDNWSVENLLKRLHQAEYFSRWMHWCFNIRWVENGLPVEHFIELALLRKADGSTIYETLTAWRRKDWWLAIRLEWDLMEQQLFLAGTMENSPHSIFVHCHCHLLQLACVQAVNNTQGIIQVYTTLTTLWKCFHYSPKRAECLKEIQRVLEMLEFKILWHMMVGSWVLCRSCKRELLCHCHCSQKHIWRNTWARSIGN